VGARAPPTAAPGGSESGGMMAAFHFLRPWWLLLVPLGALLPWLWRRRADPRSQWDAVIAPHLLAALTVGGADAFRWRPIHLVATALVLGGVAVAGPTWRKEPPPFGADTAPLVVAIDLSQTMDATDIAPTRLERVKQKVRDLVRLRPGARTGLVVYAGSAHLVVPPADDPAVLDIYVPALATGLMPVVGKHAADALVLATRLLDESAATAPDTTPPPAGTILFFTDGVGQDDVTAFAAALAQSRHQVLLLGVGTSEGGPIRASDGGILTDASGRPVRATFDRTSIQQLGKTAGVPVASVTVDDSDVRWVARRAQHHLEAALEANAELRWHESGYWLTIPLALLGALWFRRGWVVHWAAGIAVLVTMGAAPAHAADRSVADLFFTPDQQGRWHFEQADFAAAARHFDDPMWKGLSLYRAADLHAALGEFARRGSPEAFFWMGNCYARLGDWQRAITAYDNALAGRPTFPEAAANKALVAALAAKEKDDDPEAQDPNLKPDDVVFDDEGKRGKAGEVDAPLPAEQTAELWMRNLTVSPADFLKQKFQIQAEAVAPPERASGTAPTGGTVPVERASGSSP
jgi:Ca-activated chloride channel family protein